MSEEQEAHLKALLENQTRLVKAGEGIQRLQEEQISVLRSRLKKSAEWNNRLQDDINSYNNLPWYKKMLRWYV